MNLGPYTGNTYAPHLTLFQTYSLPLSRFTFLYLRHKGISLFWHNHKISLSYWSHRHPKQTKPLSLSQYFPSLLLSSLSTPLLYNSLSFLSIWQLFNWYHQIIINYKFILSISLTTAHLFKSLFLTFTLSFFLCIFVPADRNFFSLSLSFYLSFMSFVAIACYDIRFWRNPDFGMSMYKYTKTFSQKFSTILFARKDNSAAPIINHCKVINSGIIKLA